jgi:hypothetical protein
MRTSFEHSSIHCSFQQQQQQQQQQQEKRNDSIRVRKEDKTEVEAATRTIMTMIMNELSSSAKQY